MNGTYSLHRPIVRPKNPDPKERDIPPPHSRSRNEPNFARSVYAICAKNSNVACYRSAFREDPLFRILELYTWFMRVYVTLCVYVFDQPLVSFISFISYWCISGKRCPADIREYRQVPPACSICNFLHAAYMFHTHPRTFLRVCALKRFYARRSFLSNVYATTRAGKLDASFVAIFSLSSGKYSNWEYKTVGKILSPLRFDANFNWYLRTSL